jgi:transcriptional pleiotropic regulator of transition state genes
VKNTGMVRKLDELGRITLPMELRKNMNINDKDQLEIFVENGTVILRKYEPYDVFTGSTNNLIDYFGKKVSRESIIEMAKIAGI